MADYLAQLAQELGATPFPKVKAFRSEVGNGKGVVIGSRDNFLVTAGPVNIGQSHQVAIAVRAQRLLAPDQLLQTVKELPSCKSTLTCRKKVLLQDNAVMVCWPYSLKKPAAAEVRALVDEVIAKMKLHAAPFNGRCEDCDTVAVAEITLKNGTPGFHCPACQERAKEEQGRAAEEYARRDVNYVVAGLAGVVAAVIAAVAWGVLVALIDSDPGKWHPKLHCAGAVWLGIAVSLAFFKSAGKITRFGQGFAIVLTFLGKMLADGIYTGILVAKVLETSWSWPLQKNVFLHFWSFKLASGMHIFVFAMDILLSFVILGLPWSKMPNFKSEFEPLGLALPPARSQAQASV